MMPETKITRPRSHVGGHKRQSPTAKTPKQRATERRDVAQRAHDRAAKALAKLKADVATGEVEVAVLAARLEHRKADPDLRDDPQLPLGVE